MSNLQALKQEADELGVKYSPNIGEAKLQSKIDEYYASQETDESKIQEKVAEQEKAQESTPVSAAEMSKGARIKEAERKARETFVVTIIDNDQRVNNQTTSCSVNCGNIYFDLGQITLPLNMKVEVMRGHIESLKEVMIPQHTRDPKTGTTVVKMRPRYTVQYEMPE